ncbi:MAG: hypothetical protein Q9209_001445 [Squamulea sp. 1 TL-2023]
MDIHRCRFVPYPPSAINTLAFSHSSSLATSSKGLPTLRLAIGRANGDIEIWNPLRGAWHQESTFRGGKDRSIEGLVWTHDQEEQDKNGFNVPGKLRLFSIGYSSAVTEWDLSNGRPIRHASGNYGELWCMAAQPREGSVKKPDGNAVNGMTEDVAHYQSLAVGCADGSIVLLSTADGDLNFERTLTRPAKKKARVLSIAWQSRYMVVTGHADSTIRAFDIRNGQQVRSMSLGAGPEEGPKEILVWSVKCMVDGTIVSGDSTGTVSFWDAKYYSRLQRITSHKADILDLAVSADGESVFSGGMDRRTTLYRRMAGSRLGEKRRWVEIAHQRFHSHDVKVMATFETKSVSILASGGLDTTPIIVPIREFGKEHHRTLPGLPQQPPIRSAPKKRLLVSWWDREINIWRIARSLPKSGEHVDFEDLPQSPSKRLVAKVLIQVRNEIFRRDILQHLQEMQGDESITGADILQNGSLLAVSTLSSLKVFRLKTKADSTIGLRKAELPRELGNIGAKIIQWSPDGKWLLLITSGNKIQLLRIASSKESKEAPLFLPQPVNLKRLRRKAAQSNYLHGSLGAYDRSICRAAFSADSSILVAGDLSGHLDAWVLEGYEDLTQDPPLTSVNEDDASSSSSSDDSDEEDHPTVVYAQHWKHSPTAHLLSKLPSAPLIMSFRPATSSSTPPKELTNGNGHLHPTRQNPYPHSHDLPNGEDRLFIVTSEHQFYEINILAGRISDWSRRNPKSTLPDEFRAIRDRAMGCVWDISCPFQTDKGRQRVWLYGNTWLWMFDLAQDLPRPDENGTSDSGSDGPKDGEYSKMRKRKREKAMRRKGLQDSGNNHDDEQSSKRRDTGAGSRIPKHEMDTGVGRKMRKTVGADGTDAKFITLGREISDESEAEDDEEGDDEDKALVGLRRGDDAVTTNGHRDKNKIGEVVRQAEKKGPPYWGTFKYRPILGIVPIGDGDGGAGEGVEVALVERPLFDVDLPGRFYGDQEWSERKDAELRL